MKTRALTEPEVTFAVELEQEDTPVRGNATASGDDVFDKQVEDEIIERLDAGYIEAWCCLKVTATWHEFSASEYLGCCSFEAGTHQPIEAQAIECAADHGMKDEALASLNEAIAEAFSKLAPLVEPE